MRYLLDTNVISEIVRDAEGKVARRYQAVVGNCFTSIIVAAEIRYGIAKHPERTGSRDAAALLETLPIASLEGPVHEKYGSIRADLERRGTPIGANDLFIAAHALALDATLVTANEREFARVAGLKLENWAR